MARHYPTYEEWFNDLSDEKREKTLALVEKFRAHGCDNPESWARSEIGENIAQYARFLFLRKIWTEYLSKLHTSKVIRGALDRMKAAGISSEDITKLDEDISKLVRNVAHSTAFYVINRIDEGKDRDADAHAPGWKLIETDSMGNLTGREVGGLHESLDSLKPDGDC